MPEHSHVPVERIERVILVIRGHKVMLDIDLASLYDVEINGAAYEDLPHFHLRNSVIAGIMEEPV